METQPNAEDRYVFGMDWGFLDSPTAVVVMNADTREVVGMQQWDGEGFSVQRARLQKLVEQWNPVSIWAAGNALGQAWNEGLQQEGLPIRPITITLKRKKELLYNLKGAMAAGIIQLPDGSTLEVALDAVGWKEMASGQVAAVLPEETEHLLIAACLSWYGVQHSGAKISFV